MSAFLDKLRISAKNALDGNGLSDDGTGLLPHQGLAAAQGPGQLPGLAPAQQAPVDPNAPVMDSGGSDQPITVTGTAGPRPVQDSRDVRFPLAPQSPHLTNGPDAPDMGNRNLVEMAKAANKNDAPKQSHLHRILDNIGDAFLMANGMDPIHKQHRDEQAMSDALQGAYSGDDQQTRLAFERANQVDAKQTQGYYKNYQEDQYKQAQLRSLDANRQSEIDNRGQDNLTKALPIVAAMFHAARDPRTGELNPIKTQYAMDRAKDLAARLHVPIEALGVKEFMSPQELEALGESGMNVTQQERIPLARERVDIAHENAATNSRRADTYEESVRTRPRPQPHAATVVQRYVNEDGHAVSVLSDGKKVVSTDKVRQTGSAALSGFLTHDPAPPKASRFRPVK